MKKITLAFVCLIMHPSFVCASSFWLVGVDDGNHCELNIGASTPYDRLACVCMEKIDREAHWQPTTDLTRCVYQSTTGHFTQSQCLGIIYMNHPYPSISEEQCQQQGFKICDGSGDLSHCSN